MSLNIHKDYRSKTLGEQSLLKVTRLQHDYSRNMRALWENWEFHDEEHILPMLEGEEFDASVVNTCTEFFSKLVELGITHAYAKIMTQDLMDFHFNDTHDGAKRLWRMVCKRLVN